MVSKKKTTKKTTYKKWAPVEIIRKPRFIPTDGWSTQFETTFEFAVNKTGHGAIGAVAGSGKTTALVEMAYRYIAAHPTHRVLAIAFNSSIRKELQSRMPIGVTVHTCHSFNYQSVIKVWGDGKAIFELQGPKGFVAKNLSEAVIGYEKEKEDDRDSLCQAMSLAKTRLASTIEEVIEVMDQYSIESTLKREEFAKHVLWMMDQTKKAPGQSAEKGKKAISFDDQVWLPIVNNWAPAEKFDLVLVDESQDLSPARTEVARRAMKPNGRMIIVGDIFQAIYSWAGADIHALPNMIKELNATVMPLTCSFRCAKNIIKEAKQINPDIEHSPTAIDGIVDTIKPDDLIKLAKAGDAIISRTNSPLVKVFFKLAKKGTKVTMLGRDYGQMLSIRVNSWAKKAKKAGETFTGKDLLSKNDEWLEEQIEYLTKKKLDTTRAADEHETIATFCTDLPCKLNTSEATKEVLDRINNMFSKDEEPGNDDGKYCVTLSSTHKFKGLERDRVFVLRDTYRPGTSEEESNLTYVAITRAKKHLTYVRGKFNE